MPDCSRMTLSFENAENVVKPPQKPAVRKRFIDESLKSRQNIAQNTPIKKQPAILTVSVAQGRTVCIPFITSAIR